LVRLSPFATNPSTGIVKAKKLLWSDCGLAAWLAGIRNAADLARRLDPGFWLEQAIFQTLQVWRALEPSRRKIHFWRDRSGREVDFVLEKDGVLVGLEIKASRQVAPSDADGIQAFRLRVGRSHRFQRGVVLHGGAGRPLGPGLWALPWGWMLPAQGCPPTQTGVEP
jgi:hypothetical protein